MFHVTSPDTAEDSALVGSRPLNAVDPSDRDLQRAEGCARIVMSGSEKDTRVRTVFQRAPIRVMFPKLDGGTVEAVLVNIAGGIAGGDRLEYAMTAVSSASIAITSQAAEKVYRALNEPARAMTRLKACDSAKLAWLPQETIVFNCGSLTRQTEVDVSSGVELLALEWLVLGRAAHREEMVGGHITDSWRVKRDGRVIWADGFRATDEVFAHLHRKALLSNCKAIGTLIYFGPNVDTMLESFRDSVRSLECRCAVTSVGGLLIVRFAAQLARDLRSGLCSFLQKLRRELGPGPFQVPKMWSC